MSPTGSVGFLKTTTSQRCGAENAKSGFSTRTRSPVRACAARDSGSAVAIGVTVEIIGSKIGDLEPRARWVGSMAGWASNAYSYAVAGLEKRTCEPISVGPMEPVGITKPSSTKPRNAMAMVKATVSDISVPTTSVSGFSCFRFVGAGIG